MITARIRVPTTMTSTSHVGKGVEAAQQIGGEVDQRVPEQPLDHDQQHDHTGGHGQAQDVGR